MRVELSVWRWTHREGRASREQEARAGHDDGLTRDRFDIIVQHCADLAVPIEWEDLGPLRRGKCQALTGRIVLNPRMTLTQAASTLSHEAGHWEFSDTESTPANERRAWEFGASLIIEPWEYAAAEEIVGSHPAALALELDVTVRVIEAWRRWWLRRGRHQSLASR